MRDPTGMGKTTTQDSHQWPGTKENPRPHPQDPFLPATNDRSQPGRAGQHPQGRTLHETDHRPDLSLRQPTPKEGNLQYTTNPIQEWQGMAGTHT